MLFNYGDKNEKSEQPVGQPSNPVLHVETAADVGAASPVFIYYWFCPVCVTISPSCVFPAIHAHM